MTDEHKSLTVDNNTRASDPGEVRLMPLVWLRFNPKWPFYWTFYTIVFVILAVMINPLNWIPAGIFMFLHIFYWIRVKEHFLAGCSCPGVIVSLNPILIAVSTDLSMGIGSYPAIKIVRTRLPLIANQKPAIGTMVATVSLYSYPMENAPHWSDFDPYPVMCATSDAAVINAKVASFSQEDWQELAQMLKNVPQPYKEGLYLMPVDNSHE